MLDSLISFVETLTRAGRLAGRAMTPTTRASPLRR